MVVQAIVYCLNWGYLYLLGSISRSYPVDATRDK